MFEKYHDWIPQKSFKEILKIKGDREEAYSDAYMVVIYSIKADVFRGESSIKTYFYKIFERACVTYQRRNATKKNIPVKPGEKLSDELLKDFESSVQDALRGLMTQSSPDLWDLALDQFRHSNYRCYYVLGLYHVAGFSYEEILGLSNKLAYQPDDDTSFEPDELGEGLDDTPLQLEIPTPNALKAFASRCRAELRALFERLKHPNQPDKP